ncbi:MAG: ferredoxin [Acidobacteria bacterium]|nr:MAG: ferredoxin [Acidobacteriota bacterium]
MAIPLLVNGTEHRVDAPSGEALLTVLRDRLGLTGTKYGCGEGQCGACTVLLDGKPVRSCRLALGTASQKKITTIEGLAQGEHLHPVQETFLRAEAFQCAYCTSGMIMSAVALLDKNPHPSSQEIIRHMDGNICRCGTYPRILAAIRDAALRNR